MHVCLLGNPGSRLVALTLATSLYGFCIGGGVIDGAQAADHAARYGPTYFAMLWVRQDARRTRYWPADHYGFYLWLFWWFLLPHYFWRTRGRGGIRLALLFHLLLLLPGIAGLAGWWLCEDPPHR